MVKLKCSPMVNKTAFFVHPFLVNKMVNSEQLITLK